MLQNEHRLPIFNVLDEILVANWHDVAGRRHDEGPVVTLSDETDDDILYSLEYVSDKIKFHSDFWYVDAGGPLDDPLQAIP